MKTQLLAAVALAGLTSYAVAADLPSRRQPDYYSPVSAFTWTGFYLGVNAGYGVSDNGSNRYGSLLAAPGTLTAPLAGYSGLVTNTNFNNGGRDGFVGGGQVGYSHQYGMFVAGLEADLQYADLGGRRNGGAVVLAPNPPGFVGAVNSSVGGVGYFGTVRGRFGVAFDRLLVYATGGLAYGGGGGTTSFGLLANGTFVGGVPSVDQGTRVGWALGGGGEYAITPALTARLEGLYVSLDKSKANAGFIGAVGATPVFVAAGGPRNNTDFAVIRAGLNYKFNLF